MSAARAAPIAFAVVLLVSAAPARADLGPPPSCGDGTHHEYLYGHHCVPDGYHLQPGEAGIETVKDAPELAPTTKPTPTPIATTAETTPTKSTPPNTPAPAPPKRLCAYGATYAMDLDASLFLAPLAAILWRRRRRIKVRRAARG